MPTHHLKTPQDFMISRVRVRLLEWFFTHQDEMFYVRELSRAIKEEINAVRRELDRMITYGLLRSEPRGNRVYYSLDQTYPFYPELLRIVAKSTGLGLILRNKQRKLGKIDYVMMDGRFVKNMPPRPEQVDILVVGEVDLAELTSIIRQYQQKLDREINYTVFSSEEFEFRKTRRDPFVMEILYGPIIVVIGSEEAFAHRQIQGI